MVELLIKKKGLQSDMDMYIEYLYYFKQRFSDFIDTFPKFVT